MLLFQRPRGLGLESLDLDTKAVTHTTKTLFRAKIHSIPLSAIDVVQVHKRFHPLALWSAAVLGVCGFFFFAKLGGAAGVLLGLVSWGVGVASLYFGRESTLIILSHGGFEPIEVAFMATRSTEAERIRGEIFLFCSQRPIPS